MDPLQNLSAKPESWRTLDPVVKLHALHTPNNPLDMNLHTTGAKERHEVE